MPEIPAPEDVLLAALGPLGVSAAILALIGSAFAPYSWYSLGRGAIAGARRIPGLLGSAGHALVGRGPGR